jgi:TatD DNase family protein
MLIDAHAHVDLYARAGARALASAVREIRERNILTVSNSMDPDSYRRNREIAADCAWILPAFGIHPWNAPQYASRLAGLDPLIRQSPILGEIGLDRRFVEDPAHYPAQEKVFAHFLLRAGEQGKIVILHTAGAEAETLDALEGRGGMRVVVHWYSGPIDIFEKLADLGCYFTVGPEVWRSDHIRRIARGIPPERILSETDNPGGPEWLTGKPGTPALIGEVVRGIAEARNTTAAKMEQAIRENFRTLIGADPGLADFRKRIAG